MKHIDLTGQKEHEFHELNELGKRMRLTLNHCCIADVEMQEPKPTDNQRKGRRVFINIDEEDFFEMLDHMNPKNIIKYLDMRGISHREPANITVRVKPDASGKKLRHSLQRVNAEFKRIREEYKQ